MSSDRLRTLNEALSASERAPSAQIFTSASAPFTITHVNSAWVQLCGFETSEAVGQTCRILQGPDTSREALNYLHRALDCQTSIKVRLLNYTKQGVPFLNDLTVEPLCSDERDITHFVAYLNAWRPPAEALPGFPRVFETPEEDALTRDIKQRAPTSMEGALEVAGLAQIITERAPPFRITYVNEEWCHLCGYSVEEAIGKTCKILQGPETCPSTLQALQAATENCAPITVKLLNFTKDNRPFINTLYVTPLAREGQEPTHFLGILRARFPDSELIDKVLHQPTGAPAPVLALTDDTGRSTGSATGIPHQSAATEGERIKEAVGVQAHASSTERWMRQLLAQGTSQPGTADTMARIKDAPPRAPSWDMPPPPPPTLLPPTKKGAPKAADQRSMPPPPPPLLPLPHPSVASQTLSSVTKSAETSGTSTLDPSSLKDVPADLKAMPRPVAASTSTATPFLPPSQPHPLEALPRVHDEPDSLQYTPAAGHAVPVPSQPPVLADSPATPDVENGDTSASAALLLSAAAWARSSSVQSRSAGAGELSAAETASESRAAVIEDEEFGGERLDRLDGEVPAGDRVAPFLTKLHDLVSDLATDDIVRWSSDGAAFRITDVQRLASEILPRYFKHNKLGSLTQQLHTYGFIRHSGESFHGHMVYSREHFRANAASELTNIRRGFLGRADERGDDLSREGALIDASGTPTAESGASENKLQKLQEQHWQLEHVFSALDSRFHSHKQQSGHALLAIGEALMHRRPEMSGAIAEILSDVVEGLRASSPQLQSDDGDAAAMSARASERDGDDSAQVASTADDTMTVCSASQSTAAPITTSESQVANLHAEAEPQSGEQAATAASEVGERCSEERSSGGSENGASGSESPDQEGEGSDESSDSAGRSSDNSAGRSSDNSAGRSSDKSQKNGSAAGSSSGGSSGAAASSSSAIPRSEPSDRSGSDGQTSMSCSSGTPGADAAAADGEAAQQGASGQTSGGRLRQEAAAATATADAHSPPAPAAK